MQPKSILLSKTFWFNGLALAVAVATAFGYSSPNAAASVAKFAPMIVAVINVGLRYITKEPVVLALPSSLPTDLPPKGGA